MAAKKSSLACDICTVDFETLIAPLLSRRGETVISSNNCECHLGVTACCFYHFLKPERVTQDGGPKVQKRWYEIIASEEESDNPCNVRRQKTGQRATLYILVKVSFYSHFTANLIA